MMTTAQMQLSAAEVGTFDAFGFVLIKSFLQPSHVEALREAVSALKAEEDQQP